MKNEITIPLLKEEDFVAANKRRDTYALTRDQQMRESNAAIIARLESNAKNMIKCDKCGKQFSAGTAELAPTTCPDCI